MRKTINTVNLQGKLYSHTLEHKTSKKGVDYIGGTIDIQTDDAGLNIVTVNYVYVAPTYPAKGDKPERPNPTYSTLDKLITSGKTVVLDGEDATILKLTPSLAVNDFVNRDGEMIAAKRLEGGFVSILTKLPEEKERNKFEADVLISGTQLIDADEEKNIAEDYLIVHGNIFNFANTIAPVDFVVKSKGGIKYFEGLEASKSNPVFTKVWGPIQSETVVRRVEEESAFGEAAIKEYTRTTRNWVITGAASEVYEMDDAEIGITADEIKEALANREIHLAEVKKQNEEYQVSRNAGAASAAGVTAAAGGFNF